VGGHRRPRAKQLVAENFHFFSLTRQANVKSNDARGELLRPVAQFPCQSHPSPLPEMRHWRKYFSVSRFQFFSICRQRFRYFQPFSRLSFSAFQLFSFSAFQLLPFIIDR
jgi:hypothetical protein